MNSGNGSDAFRKQSWSEMKTKEQLIYSEEKPEGLPEGFVKSFWSFRNTSGNDFYTTILPDGCFDLIAEVRDNRIQGIFLTGLWTKPVKVSVSRNTFLWGIRFRLLSAEYILRQKLAAILNGRLELGYSFWELDQLHPLEFTDFCVHVSGKIHAIVRDTKSPDPRKILLFQILDKSKGAQPVSMIACEACWSSRQINRYFNSWFGFSLKEYCRIQRVSAAIKDVGHGNISPPQSYFDQSHFIKEIRKYTGVNPGELSRNENDRFLQLTTMKNP